MSTRVPGISARLAGQVVDFVSGVRNLELLKPPGVSETLDWAEALTLNGSDRLDRAGIEATSGALLKFREDIERVRAADLTRALER